MAVDGPSASSSDTPAPPPGLPDLPPGLAGPFAGPTLPLGVNPKEDHRMETGNAWIRLHVVPRHAMFLPPDIPGGPGRDALGPIRVTQMVFTDGHRDTRTEGSRSPTYSKAKTLSKWTGRSTFRKKIAAPRDTAAIDTSDVHLQPGRTIASLAGLAGLRSELAKAQRQDKHLDDIRCLRKEPAGS